MSGPQANLALRAELDRQSATALSRIFSTPAARKRLNNDPAATFNDACGFWDITVRSNANTLQSRLSDVTTVLTRALDALPQEAGEGLRINNMTITRFQLESMVTLHKELQDRFRSELDILRKRTDERLEKRSRPV